jgi:hypothetical protein
VDGETRAIVEKTDRRTVSVRLSDDDGQTITITLSPGAAYALGALLCRSRSDAPGAGGACTVRGSLTLPPAP